MKALDGTVRFETDSQLVSKKIQKLHHQKMHISRNAKLTNLYQLMLYKYIDYHYISYRKIAARVYYKMFMQNCQLIKRCQLGVFPFITKIDDL